MEYKRLTERVNKGQVKFILKDGENPIEKFQNALDRLAELEDKIEQGTLIELKEPHIVKNEGSVCYEVWWQEVVNRFDWFDTKEEAEKKLKELQE